MSQVKADKNKNKPNSHMCSKPNECMEEYHEIKRMFYIYLGYFQVTYKTYGKNCRFNQITLEHSKMKSIRKNFVV